MAAHPFSRAYAEDLKSALACAPNPGCLDGKSVLITGATGTIGRFLADALALRNAVEGAGIRVYAAGRSPEKLAALFQGREGVTPVCFDAEKPFEPDYHADFIVHAACSAHPRAYAADPAGIMRANILGTLSLLEYAKGTGAALLFLSSGEVYGENPTCEAGFSEGDSGYVNPMNPRSCYPESKRAAETLCACYAAQHGVRAMAARLCHTYGPTVGPENSRADAQFLRRALLGEDIVMKSKGEQVRSFLYAADCAGALMTLLDRGQAGEAYNAANPASVASVRDFAGTLAALSGVSLRFEVPPDAEKAGYSRVTRAVLNPAKLMSLGWTPRFSLREGLAHTLDAAREAQTNAGKA